jgi:tellurite resistance protein
MMAPPAVAGLSWFAYDGGRVDVVQQGLLGLAVLFVAVQVAFLPRYVRLAFTLGFWSFAFPSAFVGAYLIVWFSKAPFAGWQAVAIAIVVVVSALILAISILSIRLYLRGLRASR